ncbi:hypothetical protein PsorP6_009165 [Peronosclerospora sorghi]|uniref:Uncharacterized protein n=1 Tax=Peronosclerospora sorghi TaxID=230839 RepID=A0ACC0VZ88_9STRA|nr:hypothetical protein PsorP6_009165 [Peronosclerospora sorghi]
MSGEKPTDLSQVLLLKMAEERESRAEERKQREEDRVEERERREEEWNNEKDRRELECQYRIQQREQDLRREERMIKKRREERAHEMGMMAMHFGRVGQVRFSSPSQKAHHPSSQPLPK